MTSNNGHQKVRVAILVENSFEDSELQVPCAALSQAGASICVIGSRMNDEYKGKQGKVRVKPSATATEVRAQDFDAIVIPGGAAPDRIRTNPNAVRFVMEAMDAGKPIAAVCHGPQVLIEADRLRGKTATGFLAIRQDLENAGVNYINEPLVIDGNLITSRQPGDLPIFATAILDRLGLTIENMTLPDTSDNTYEWWQLGEAWGGSSRSDIVNALNAAIAGENYTLNTFEHYIEKLSDPELSSIFQEIRNTKQEHIQNLETRLANFGDRTSWQSKGGETYANLQNLVQSDDDIAILRRALGEIQTGVVDTYNLYTQLTDPITVAILTEVESNLAQYERRLGELYRARLGENVEPPIPTVMTLAS
jgi:protease I